MLGEEAVRVHRVEVIDDQVHVTVSEPDQMALRKEALASLVKGIDNGYNGQIARDCLRLLHAGVEPVEIVWEAMRHTTPRTEFGWDHAQAMTTDCLHALDRASERMLRHDLAHEIAPEISGYGWLDITHSLTYANAARWAWREAPGPTTARLALFTVFHLADSLRHAADDERTDHAVPNDSMVKAAFNDSFDEFATALIDTSLDDRSGALIVVAHHVKVARAAVREAQQTGSRLPLAAAARFLTAPARQRFVVNGVDRARHFLTTGNPPPR